MIVGISGFFVFNTEFRCDLPDDGVLLFGCKEQEGFTEIPVHHILPHIRVG